MTDKFVVARNTVSGVVGPVPASYLTHPHFGKNLVLAEDGAKDFVPELYKVKDAEEFTAARASRSKLRKAETEDEVASSDNETEEVLTDE